MGIISITDHRYHQYYHYHRYHRNHSERNRTEDLPSILCDNGAHCIDRNDANSECFISLRLHASKEVRIRKLQRELPKQRWSQLLNPHRRSEVQSELPQQR